MYAVKLDHLDKDYKTVGIKGYNLGQMTKEGLPVPPGFIITVDAFENFMKANKIKEKIAKLIQKINYNDDNSIREASETILNIIKEAQMPDYIENVIKQYYEEISVGRELRGIGGAALDLIKAGRDHIDVSVRSSPVNPVYASNHLKVLLNIKGANELLDAVKTCWASLFSQRSLILRKSKRMSDFPTMALVVQKMLDADKSGLVFTSQIERGDAGKLVIESSWGLGESINQGLVTPDEYILDKINGNILERNIHKKLWLFTKDDLSGKTIRQTVPRDKIEAESLSESELKKIWSLSRRIEEIYNGQPQMIEWCEERSRLFIMGTRRVDANKWNSYLANNEPADSGRNILMKGLGVSPGRTKGKVRIIVNPEDSDMVQRGDIVVTRMTDSKMIAALKKASAILTDEGGRSSNASSISSEFGIPCIVGLENATNILKNDQEIIIDATKGIISEVYVPSNLTTGIPNNGVFGPQTGPVESNIFPERAMEQQYKQGIGKPVNTEINPNNISDDFTATSIKAVLSFANSASSASEKADGALLKVEYILTEGGMHPDTVAKTNPEQLVNKIIKGVEKVAKKFYPKPVWYRSLDATSDIFKKLGGFMEPEESNPIMGWHGIRRSLDRPEVFKCELEALKKLHQNGLNNIALNIPFISKLEELQKVKQLIDFPIKIGISVETPAVALNIESFCKEGVDFVSIDSSILAQLILGVDRDNMQIYRLYSETDPSVISLIKHVVMVCNKYRVETSICGEAANNPEIIETLIKLGINSISTEIDTIDHIKSSIARVERKLLLDRMRRQHNL